MHDLSLQIRLPVRFLENSRIHRGRENGLRVSGPGTLALLVRGLTRFSCPHGFLSCLTSIGWEPGEMAQWVREDLSLVSSTSTHARWLAVPEDAASSSGLYIYITPSRKLEQTGHIYIRMYINLEKIGWLES